MEPLLDKELEHITKQLNSVRELLEKRTGELKKSDATAADRLQVSWGHQKRASTLERYEEDYDAVEAENKAAREERAELREGLSRLLEYTKALAEALRDESNGKH